MLFIKVGNEKLGSVTLPSDTQGYSGSMSVKTTNQHPLSTRRQRMFPLAMIALLAAAFGFNPGVRAQDVAPPISGVLGQVQSVGDRSFTIQNKSGLFHINITQPLRTFHEVPSELRGAVEGSVVMDAQPGAATPSRMTNGSVSLRRTAESHSRMTNGVVRKA